jgi:hypothetical protein
MGPRYMKVSYYFKTSLYNLTAHNRSTSCITDYGCIEVHGAMGILFAIFSMNPVQTVVEETCTGRRRKLTSETGK